MKEPGQRDNYQFPWCNGALPKALRSSRARLGSYRKVDQPPCDLNRMELLAAVAGQVLQDKTRHEGMDMVQKVDGDEERAVHETDSSSHAELPSLNCQVLESPDKHMVEEVPKSHEGGSIMQTMVQQGSEKATPRKAYRGAGLDDVSPNKVVFPGYKESLPCSNSSNSSNDKEEWTTVGNDGIPPVLEIGTPDLRKTGCIHIHMHPEAHEKNDTNCSGFSGGNAREGSDMTLLPDSSHGRSNSSKEITMLVHTSSRFQALERHLGFSQDLDRFNAKDDDDNFSGMVAPVAASPTTLSRPLVSKASPIGEFQHGSVQEEGDNTQKKDWNSTREWMVEDSRRAKTRYPCGSKFRGVLDKSGCPKTVNMDAKEASVASPPTTASKASWTPVEKKRKLAQESSGVKVNITSFEVPELSINLPETATIASLKRAVMEAAVDLLAGGLHVRVLHHGKRVHDENSTLVQMGIPCKGRTDSLAFMLEPDRVASISMDVEESLFACQKPENQPETGCPISLWAADVDGHPKEAINREVAGDNAASETSNDASRQEKSDTDSQVIHPCPPPKSFRPTTAALILHPGFKENQSVVSATHSFEGFTGKRRTRRPFTVTEVEALVQAVELLGTGRWREVKQQVFSHARHRTYVDLKDKWKTLVHTARIAPHQRRGEPVPQELLDRVLRAHTYWALLLARQHEALGI